MRAETLGVFIFSEAGQLLVHYSTSEPELNSEALGMFVSTTLQFFNTSHACLQFMKTDCFCILEQDVICVLATKPVPKAFAPWLTVAMILARFLTETRVSLSANLSALRSDLHLSMSSYTVHSATQEIDPSCNDTPDSPYLSFQPKLAAIVRATEPIGYNYHVAQLPGYLGCRIALIGADGRSNALFESTDAIPPGTFKAVAAAFPFDTTVTIPATATKSTVLTSTRQGTAAGVLSITHAFRSDARSTSTPAHAAVFSLAQAVLGGENRGLVALAATALASGLIHVAPGLDSLPAPYREALDKLHRAIDSITGGVSLPINDENSRTTENIVRPTSVPPQTSSPGFWTPARLSVTPTPPRNLEPLTDAAGRPQFGRTFRSLGRATVTKPPLPPTAPPAAAAPPRRPARPVPPPGPAPN
ncbi:hypothetical protein J8273_7930 [Carpediemonas membranifera]|uniref:Uncharacterized protein n=1 Tax=Carpediemonas membranifera TaxID=201153 RepID=A0A8J6DXN2_9EUKA|nr:hypothetical protein J8273_7930 [Carpediemonas membranifera]|eukprot:KAG9390579.1 hypothetical protein J8273_7930 [Carpediemonas membranifera]